MFDRFSSRARMVMSIARQQAERFNHNYIDTKHILLALLADSPAVEGVARNVLQDLEVDADKLRPLAEALLKPNPDVVTIGQLPFTPLGKSVLDFAISESKLLNHNYVGTEHLLLGLLHLQGGPAQELLLSQGLTLDNVRAEICEFLGMNKTTGRSGMVKIRSKRDLAIMECAKKELLGTTAARILEMYGVMLDFNVGEPK